MSTVTKNRIRQAQQYSGPSGNKFAKVFRFNVNASGVCPESDLATAVQVNDVVRIGVLQSGMELHDALAIVSDAFAASTTADIGFAYVDGVDSTAVPQDADYFFAALATSSAGRTRATNTAVAPVVLPKDAYLILTTAVAANAKASRIDVVLTVASEGQP